jgi:cyclophilin family peptidyl-prolyl cis-trans isomerase
MTRHRTLAGFAALVAIPVLASCTGGTAVPTIPPATPATSAGAPTHPAVDGGMPEGCPTEQPDPLAAGETRTVTVETDLGTFEIEVEADLSPIAAGNFVALAECGYYDGVVFHRVDPGFVIQGGDGQFGRAPNVEPAIVGSGGPPYTIADEPVTADYVRGAVAMAKSAEPDSASSQFFVVLRDLGGGLEKRYQILGHVTEGMDVVDAISNVPNDGSQMSLAVDPVPMTDVSVATP